MLERVKRALGAVAGTAKDFGSGLARPEFRQAILRELSLVPTLTTGALPWLIRAGLGKTLLDGLLRNAKAAPHELALEMGSEQLTWSQLAEATSARAHVLHDAGVRPGEVVALIGPNAPEYLAWVFACTRVGATAALINTNLEGRPLEHALSSSTARVWVVHERWCERLPDGGSVLRYGDGTDADSLVANAPSSPYPPAEIDPESDFVYIYTSGTTGLPKPCRIAHARAIMAGAGFGPVVFGLRKGDKLYNVLPLYHASGLLIGVGSAIVTRTPMALREKFSAREFWPDVARYQATAILYIGELCRYLVNAPEHPAEKNNSVRVAVGNGLRPDVWPEFERRFGIPMIREFYGATEAPGFIFNLTGKVGSVGRVPMRRSGWISLVRYDVDRDEHVRDADGRMVECAPGEVGEMLVRLAARPTSGATEYRGYTDAEATSRKILSDVFVSGDRYFRTGDLLRRDEDDYFYFVDRIGDTFRWKGENVSTAEVADTLTATEMVQEATVVGVEVPGNEGRAGLAALVIEGEFDPSAFGAVAATLPAYAQPVFVRILSQLEKTGTFKVQKTQLRSEGADPTQIEDALYVRVNGEYEPLDAERWDAVCKGTLRL